ncbi:MAG: hypothetical protein Q8O89_06810 [Nanoarchaeota archaeon]|nr:hypothetical protein [Nanoarchaeota archaeon]
MMRKIKGCGNELCEAHKKKLTFKESETFCSKCGKTLVGVCKDCYTQLSADADKLCVRCHAKHEDRKDKAMKFAAGFGTGALAFGGVLLKYGSKTFAVVKKIKF